MDTLFYFEVIDISEDTLKIATVFAILRTFNSTVNPLIYASIRFFPPQNTYSRTFNSTVNPLIYASRLFLASQSVESTEICILGASKNIEPSKQETPTPNFGVSSSRPFSLAPTFTPGSAGYLSPVQPLSPGSPVQPLSPGSPVQPLTSKPSLTSMCWIGY